MDTNPKPRKRLSSVLILVGILLMIVCCLTARPILASALSPHIDQGVLDYGHAVYVPISGFAPQHVWHFRGKAGQTVIIHANCTAINSLSLYAPDGSQLAVGNQQDSVTDINLNLALPQTGDYLLEVQIIQMLRQGSLPHEYLLELR